MVQKRFTLRTSQSMHVVTDISMFTVRSFVEFVSSHDRIFTVLPESQTLTVPPVSTRIVTLCRFYRVGKLTFKTAVVFVAPGDSMFATLVNMTIKHRGAKVYMHLPKKSVPKFCGWCKCKIFWDCAAPIQKIQTKFSLVTWDESFDYIT